MVGRCPATNSKGHPCRFQGVWQDGRCPYHTTAGRIVPGQDRDGRGGGWTLLKVHPRRVLESPLPSLRGEITLERLLPWAEEFDRLDDHTYMAADFIRWLEFELSKPVKAGEVYDSRAYSVVGAAAAAMRQS